MKLDLAKELLANEKTSVTDVATTLGYADIYHFSKLFKAKTGFAPSEYKKNNS
jgi:two-component system response regulator YesN